MLMLLCLFNVVLNLKQKNTVNYPKLRALKWIGKIALFPLKCVAFLYLVLMAYGGNISLLAMFYRTAMVIILTQILIKAHKLNLTKIRTTNYIRFLSFLTYVYLLIYSIVIVLLKALAESDVSGSDKELTRVQSAVN